MLEQLAAVVAIITFGAGAIHWVWGLRVQALPADMKAAHRKCRELARDAARMVAPLVTSEDMLRQTGTLLERIDKLLEVDRGHWIQTLWKF